MTETQPRKGLGAVATRGAAVTFSAQIIRITIQLGGIVLLGRLLSPSDYGVVTMVVAITGVGEILRDFGLSSAAIQAKTLSTGQRANLFWINVGIGTALAAIVAALALPIAAFYDDDRLILITLVLSSTFFFNGVATQFRADLARHFKFGQLAGTEIFAQATALVVALVLAAWGWGYWALVAQQVLQAFVLVIALPIIGAWWPGLPKRGEQMRPLLRFGGSLVVAQVLNYATRNVASIVIGRNFGAQQLGYYSRAYQLMVLPLNQINAPSTRVALPTLSRLQDEPKRYAEFISFGQTALLNLVSFVLAICVAQAPAVVLISIGPQWAATVPIFQILAIAGFFQAATYATYWVFLSHGLTREFLWYTVWTRPFCIAIIVTGAIWGVSGVAVGYLIVAALLWPTGAIWVARRSTAPMMRLFLNGLRTLVIYGIAAAISFVSTIGIPEELPLVRLIVGMAALLGALGLTVLVFPPFRRDVVALFSARRFLRRGAGGAPVAKRAASPEEES